MKTLKLCALVTLISFIFSGNILADKDFMRYGKISAEEIAMTSCPIDSNASAVVLGALGNTEFRITESDITTIFQKHVRIKVFDKEAFNKGDFKFYLYKDGTGDEEKAVGIKGFVYNMKDGKLEKTKLSNKNIFKKELDKNHDVINIACPNVKEGSIIDLSYQIQSPFIFNLQSWDFQDDIPTLYSEYNVDVIEWYNYKNWVEGYIMINKTEKETHETFSFRTEARIDQNGRTPGQNVNFEAKVTHMKYVAKDVPAFKNEPYITTARDYISSVQFELQSTRYPWSVYKSYTSTWAKINHTLLNTEKFGGALKGNAFLNDISETISSKASTPVEKACLAYNHISKRMAWNEAFRIYPTTSIRKAYMDAKGSSADINMNLVALCKKLGLDAYPVIISTRKHGMVRPGLVSLTQFNHVITAVSIDGQYLLMDATEGNCPFNLLPSYCLNGRGRLVREGMGDWVDLYSRTPKTEIYMVNLKMDEELNLNGSLTYQGINYAAVQARKAYKSKESEEKFIKYIEEDLKDAEISEFTIENVDSIDKPIIIKSDIVLKNRVSQAGDMVFLNPKVINRAVENIFKREERVYPVDYNYPTKEQIIITLTIPEGYTIDELPEQMITALPDNKARYVFAINKIGQNTIQLTNMEQINQTIFSGVEYPNLRKFNEMIVAKEAEQVVLKKVN